MAMSPNTGKRQLPAETLPGAALHLALLVAAFAAVPAVVAAERQVVDLELILAVDVSSSMSEAEQQVQRDGYVSAFRHPDVARAIRLGPHGAIAVSYVEWAGPGHQRIVVPWTIIHDGGDAERFADALASRPIRSGAGTSISAGLLLSRELFARSGLTTERRVVDVSGDGPNNAGPPVAPARDRLVASGISVNGLPITLSHDSSGAFESFGQVYLEAYFERCVIGGPDAFVIGVHHLSEFEVAVRRKLVREIAGLPARIWLASSKPSGPVVDCSSPGEMPGR